MPTVDVSLTLNASADEVWGVVTDVESYPDCMDSVQSVTITTGAGTRNRTADWSVLLRGSVLRWSEREELDDEQQVITFEQVDGDLALFSGYWRVTPDASERSTVTLHVDFEIGIPLLADMLNPVAATALDENARQMLHALERRALSEA
jgi:ribosome-associated toxin RatA of RatAB toxin-antitoxin module